MSNQRYLHCKRDRLYFRRRIPGFSTKIAPITVALGTTDRVLGHIWSEHLSLEFNLLFDTFIFMTPPLAEPLVAQYFNHCLASSRDELQRQRRLIRMSGRCTASYDSDLELQSVVLNSLLEDGVRKNLPPQRIDPAWSPDQLHRALVTYAREAQNILARNLESRLSNEFTTQTGTSPKSLEHIAQLREARLRARLTAVKMADEAGLITPSAAPLLVPPVHDFGSLQVREEELKPRHETGQFNEAFAEIAAGQIFLASTNPANSKPSKKMLTIAALASHFEDARDLASEMHRGAYTSDLAHIFWRIAAKGELSSEMIKQRSSDLRLFEFITGVTCITEIRSHHLTYWSDTLGKMPKTFLKSSKDFEVRIDEMLLRSRNMPKDEVGLHSTTIRRHIKTMELVLARGASEGHNIASDLNLLRIKPRKSSRTTAHKARAVFRVEEAKLAFSHSVWQGCHSPGRRHLPGNMIVRDCRYWIPLILAYTGARRAEIAGLLTDDIQIIEDVPCIVIQSNMYRGIKGEPKDATERAQNTHRSYSLSFARLGSY